MNEDLKRDLEQSDLEVRPYRFWDDQWNDTNDYNYEKHAESD